MLMKSLRDFTLTSTLGHTIQIKSEGLNDVPAALVAAAMEKGCVPADPEDAPFHEDMSRSKLDFVGDLRQALIYLAIEKVLEENDPMSVDGSGYPKAGVISDLAGFNVVGAEVAPVFQLYMTLKQDGKEYPLPANAELIRSVMDANDKAELLLLAEQAGIAKTKAKALNGRDLRKLVLTKLTDKVATAE